MTNMQKSLEKETNQSLLQNKSGNGLINNVKASKKTITDLNLVQDGDSTLPSGRRTHLRQRTGNKQRLEFKSKLGFVTNIILSRYLDTSTKTQMAQIMVQYGISSRSSWAKSVWSSYGTTTNGKGNSRKFSCNTDKKKFQFGNVYSYTEE